MTVERRKRDFKTQLKTKWADWGFIAVMLAVPLLNLLIFYFGVNINSVLLAFKENIGGETVFSLYNFQRLFKEFASSASVVNEALKNTLIFFFLSFIIITPLSLIFAYFLYKKIYGYKIFRFVFFLPSIISATVLTTLYKQLILPDGVISQLVRLVGGEVPLLGYLATEDTALWAIVVYTLWTGFGVNYHSHDLADRLHHADVCNRRSVYGQRADPAVYERTVRHLYDFVLDFRSRAGRKRRHQFRICFRRRIVLHPGRRAHRNDCETFYQ